LHIGSVAKWPLLSTGERKKTATMPMDEDNQDDHILFNHPERGGYSAAEARAASVTAD